MNSEVCLKVDNLRTYFKVRRPHVFAEQPTVYAVDGVSFEIALGRTLGPGWRKRVVGNRLPLSLYFVWLSRFPARLF